jgi:hypothetical protein
MWCRKLAAVCSRGARALLKDSDMSDLEKADKVSQALKTAEVETPQQALLILNGLAGLVQGDGEQELEVQDARIAVFMAICELGKALHRGQPTEQLWGPALNAAERWRGLLR